MIDMSKREQRIWVELSIDLIVLLYYLGNAARLVMHQGLSLMSPEMGLLVSKTIALAIILSILAAIFLPRIFKEEADAPADEREKLFELRSYKFGYFSQCFLLIFLVAQVALSHVLADFEYGHKLALSAIELAHTVLLVLIACSFAQTALRLYYYRRGY